MQTQHLFFSTKDDFFYQLLAEKFDSNWSNSDFKEFGLSANSSILNFNSFFSSLIDLITLHVLVLILKKFLDNWCNWDFWRCPMDWFKWIIDKCTIIMMYGLYIRFIMQMHLFLLVYSIYDIYSFNLSNLFNIISFSFAIFILILCLSFTGIVLYLSLSSYETSDEEHNKIGEFFIGIKMEKRYKFFVFVLILRKTLFVILLISLMSISSKVMIIILGNNNLKSNSYYLH